MGDEGQLICGWFMENCVLNLFIKVLKQSM